MRKLIIAAAAMLLSIAASAQYYNVRYETGCQSEIVQIDQYDESTLVYFTYTSGKDNQYCYLNDETSYVAVPGIYKKFKVKSITGIGITSAKTSTMVRHDGDKLNFVIEFEKFPIDKPFKLIENDKNREAFNFTDVTVDESMTTSLINPDDFLDFAGAPMTGTYYDGGSQMRFWSEDGLMMTAHFVTSDEFGKIFKIYLEIVNNTGRTVDFVTTNIKVSGEYIKSGKTFDAPVLSYNDFDKKVVNNLGWSTPSTPASRLSDDLRWMSKRSDNSTGTTIALSALSLLAAASDQDNVKTYQQAMADERARVTGQYLKSNTLQDGDVYGGFVAVKNNRVPDRYRITVTIGDRDYVWLCNVK